MSKDVYTDRLSFQETLMIGLQTMYKEAAQDGFDREFEDLVDLMGFQISFLIKKAKRWDDWEAAEDHGKDITIMDTVKVLKAKRTRIRLKMILIVEVMDKYGLLLKHIKSYKWDFDPTKLEGESVRSP